jgi:outer membrane protein OmpA-like peptidoglycan-associated protein
MVNGGNVERLPFNDDNYTTQHPALSEDGSTLYFASDRPGGYGESDLYQVAINEDGTFGTPENLGDTINTEANEGFPFVSADLLYFASNGQLGLGGLDLFVAPISGSSFGNVRNLGVPINSSSDDFSFTFDAETQTGFFSSNREGGKGSDDIYKATQISPICDVDYVFTITDKTTGEILSGAVVSLADADGNKVGSKTTDANGMVTFKVTCNTDMVVEVTKAEYESAQQDVEGTDETTAKVGVALEPIEVIITEDMVELNPIFFEFDKHNITKEAAFELDKLVEAMNKYPELNIKVETHTDRRGSESYNQTLSEKRAKATVQYLISKGIAEERLTSEGKGETSPIVDCTSCTSEQHAQNRRSEFLIVKE